MKIYTRTGDAGMTSLYRGGRIRKDDGRVEAYGTLDELNACLGAALAFLPPEGASAPAAGADAPGSAEAVARVRERVSRTQTELFALGAELATLGEQKPAWRLAPDAAEALEAAIDALDAGLPPMTTFILPGGSPAGAQLHVARTVARRAERDLVRLEASAPVEPAHLAYLNRLSDYLFVAARAVNAALGTPEPPLAL